jgi:hypothetical protein
MSDFNEIGTALAKAQCEMANPKFDKTNPHFKNKFASLAAVRDAVVPVLAKHGIACIQDLQTTDGGVTCRTHLIHNSGQTIVMGPLEMPVSKQDAQGFGSAATYARRYHLMAVACVVGDEDDDANAAAAAKPAKFNGTPAQGWDHKPIGDVTVTPEANAYANAFHAALSEGGDVYAVHLDLHNEGEETYRAAWSLLDSKSRTAIKKIIDSRKAA